MKIPIPPEERFYPDDLRDRHRERKFRMPYHYYGGVTELADKFRMGRVYLSKILTGDRPCPLWLAAKLEEYFIEHGIPMNRWDILYGVKRNQSFEDYVIQKLSQQQPE